MTIKQKLAAQKILENHGNISRAMLEVGYSPATAKTPQNLTQSKGWNELIEKYLPDDKLLQKHDEALEATKTVSAVKTSRDATADSTDFIDVPDYPTRLRAVELGYKVKGRLLDAGVSISGEKVIAILGGATVQNVSEDNGHGQDS